MAYQRAQWKSGLTYQQRCPNCFNLVRYTDQSLDYRPWFADGYVDCPVCASHLRHSEMFAIDRPGGVGSGAGEFSGTYCTNCGNKLGESDQFCSQCGTKRS